MPPVGKAASIHAARARAYRAQLDEIEAALDKAKITEGGTPAERVMALASEVKKLRQTIEDDEWERA
jgi:hypothetical protein